MSVHRPRSTNGVHPSSRPSTHELVTRVRTTGRALLFAVVGGKKEERPRHAERERQRGGGGRWIPPLSPFPLRPTCGQAKARSRVRGQESCGGKGGASHGLGAARDKWVERSGAGACRTAAGCSARTNGSRGRGPCPCWSVSCVPRKGVLRDPRPLRLWLSSPVVAWPSTLTKPRCAGIGRPNHNQPTPSNHSRDLWPPGDLLLLLTRTILSTEEPLRHFLLHQFLSHFLP